jgi:5-methylcytosine-specific restriction endonuclease McrA
MSKKKQNIDPNKREQVMRKTDGRCLYCGGTADTVDHFYPLNRRDIKLHDMHRKQLINLVPACGHCNRKKRNMLPDEFREWWWNKHAKEKFWGEQFFPLPKG